MEKLVSILASNPLVTLIVVAVLILAFMVLFKSTIEKYLIKKYGLFTETEVKSIAKHMLTKKRVSKADINSAVDTHFKKYMKAKAVLFMFLISLISFTGFSNTDLRQNSVVDDVVCISADSIIKSDVASVDFRLQNTNFSYAHSVVKSDTIKTIIGTKQFSQEPFYDYPITDVGKEISVCLFEPLTITSIINLYYKNTFKNKINYEKRCNCWLVNPTKKPRDGISI